MAYARTGLGRYIGRVGALAVALGIGSAIATPAGLAWASPAADSTTNSVNPKEDSKSTESTSETKTDEGTDSSTTTEDKKGQTESNSGGADEPATTDEPVKKKKSSTARKADHESKATDTKTPAPAHVSTRTVKSAKTAGSTATSDAAVSSAGSQGSAAVATTTQAVASTATTTSLVQSETVQPKTVTSPIAAMVHNLVSAFLGTGPGGSAESPLAWVFLAAARRQVGETEETEPTEAVATTLSAQTTTAALAANQSPTVSPTFGTPDAATGAVAGKLNGSDPEGQTLTYGVTTGPTSGTLSFDNATGNFTYTPTTAQRIGAGVTTADDTIAMTVSVSDGTNTVSSVVNIPVSPAAITKTGDVTVNGGGAVATTNNRAYITNKSAGTVTVIDTTTNTVVSTIAVGATPDGVVLKPDGTRLYVSSATGNTVTVVNTATNTVVTTIAVAKPTAMAINSSGSVLYVANYDAGTVTKISTSTNAVSGAAVTLPAGSHPTELTVSPDKTKIYVLSVMADGSTGVSAFALSSSSSTAWSNLFGTATGVAVSPDNSRLYVTTNNGTNSTVTVYNTTTKAVAGSYAVSGVLAGVSVSNDGSTLVVADNKGKITTLNSATGATLSTLSTRTVTTAMSQLPGLATSPDGTKIILTDYDQNKVRVVTLAAATGGGGTTNQPPVVSPTVGAADPTTGAVSGAINGTDPNGDPLTYTVAGAPTKGSLVLNANGTFTYTPTAAARHAAATTGASTALTTDTFTVTVSDGKQGTATATVTINISPTNTVPTVRSTTPIASSTTGQSKGQVVGSDADSDKLTYTSSTPAKGTVTFSGSIYTYTPTAAARHAAAATGATSADKTDTFTITADDGHGGTATVTVTVTIPGANSAPTGAAASVTSTNTTTGTVTGKVTAVDADGDALTVTSTAPTKGSLTINANGTFSYTPTAAARQAASAAGAPASAKIDTVTFTVADAYGGKTTVSFSLPVTPYSTVNQAPTNVQTSVNNPTVAIGEVDGTVSATDPEGGPLTYTVKTGPNLGSVALDATTGKFSYTPNVTARYLAAASAGTDTDTFTVNITDNAGNTVAKTVTVTVAPPDSSAASIDQRGTTVAMNVQEMYFYSQADTDKAFALLKADGVTSVRMLIPWAGVETTNNVYNWSAIDRMVNSAQAHDMTILGVVDSTPTWAGVPGGAPLSAAPADPQEFASFMGALATRYKGEIGAYEIWNEPNGYQFWSPAPNAADYVAILKAAYPVIKAADPNAVVIAAGLGSVISFGTLTIDPVTYLQQMYDAGAQGYFDAVAFHPYLYTKAFSTPSPYASAPINQVEAMHAIMVAYGDGAKQIWATEYGQPSDYASQQNQADYIADFLRTWRTLSYAGPAFIDTIKDTGSADDNSSTLGVYNLDWTPKLAVAVIEAIIDENQAIIAAEQAQSAAAAETNL